MTGHRPHRIVFANEKGGTGKSTTAVHVAVALAYQGARVAAIDLDHRQRTMDRYFENRDETARRRGIALPTARCEVFAGGGAEALEEKAKELAADADFLLFATPGRDDPLAQHAAKAADTLDTPDWVVVRNRTGHTEARNMVRSERALTELSKRVGFRGSSGLSERVIYRELFPSGLTLLDKGHLGDLGTSHLVARQELRQLVQNLNLPVPEGADRALEAA